jgi:hypothetical protein
MTQTLTEYSPYIAMGVILGIVAFPLYIAITSLF